MSTTKPNCDQQIDRVSRRALLQMGAFGFAGFTLADLLRAEGQAGRGSSTKALINIHLSGGPSHQDLFDLKPNAPVEFRGEFNPIQTNVPGLDICEHLPQLAKMADKFAVIRSLVGSNAGHSNFQTHSGFNQRSLTNIGGRPALGSVISKIHGSAPSGAPPFVSYNGGSAGYLGPVHKPFSPNEAKKVLRLSRGLTADRLDNRTALLQELDTLRRDVDASGQLDALDSYTQRALEMVTSGQVADALELVGEDQAVVDRYGRTNRTLLTARRLIEAGVRVITLNAPWGGWDTHNNNFVTLRRNLPKMDAGLGALLWDLDRLGMLDDVSVVVWGEFGRTPRVNQRAGRDHWPRLSTAFVAGGGMRTGQAVGASTKNAEYAKDRPVDYQEVHATLYHNLGIDPVTTTFTDPNGPPSVFARPSTPDRGTGVTETIAPRPLGRTDILVSPVALGCWPIAGMTSLEVNRTDSLATLNKALECGVGFWDTAYCYGASGESERLIAEALRGRRDEVVLATKGGIEWDAAGRRVQDASPQRLREQLEESLRRLQTDRVELLYLHAPDPRTPLEESAAELARLAASGKARSIGLSNVDLQQARQFHAVCPLTALQPPYNMLQRQAELELLPWCRQQGIAACVYWPLMKGLLAGKLTRDHVFSAGDGRAKYPMFQGDEWDKNQDFVDCLRQMSEQCGRSVAEIVVNWTIHQPGVTAALCGAKRPGQIAESAAALTWRLTPDQLEQIDRALAARGEPQVGRAV